MQLRKLIWRYYHTGGMGATAPPPQARTPMNLNESQIYIYSDFGNNLKIHSYIFKPITRNERNLHEITY